MFVVNANLFENDLEFCPTLSVDIQLHVVFDVFVALIHIFGVVLLLQFLLLKLYLI